MSSPLFLSTGALPLKLRGGCTVAVRAMSITKKREDQEPTVNMKIANRKTNTGIELMASDPL